MLKVLIVDDEILVRLALKSSVDWESNGFELIGEAEDGLDALKYMDIFKPDIVITDISMPNMDGIELIKQIKQNYSHTEIIILSCHNDFKFVREGMKLGAADYILKLSMKIEELIELLNKLKEKINANELISNNNTLVNSQNNDKLNFILRVLNNDFVTQEEDYKKAEEAGFSVKNKYCIAVILQIDKERDIRQVKQVPLNRVIENIIQDVMTGFGIGDMVSFEEGKYLYIFSFSTKDLYKENFMKIEDLCRQTITLIDKFVQTKSSCGIGGVVKGFENLKISYEQAYEELKKTFYTGNLSINIYNELQEKTVQIMDCPSYKTLVHCIDTLDINNLKNNFVDWLLFLEKCRDNDSQIVKKYIHKLLLSLENNVKYFKPDTNYIKSTQKAYINIQEQNYLDQVIETISICIDEFIEETKVNNMLIYRKEVMMAKEYIEKHYQEDIKVSTISKYVNMNSDYFSHVFKKETRINFSDYLNKVRIEKAKEYMKTNQYKIYEIAYKVGYANESYFVKKFKNETGLKPTEYIKKLNSCQLEK